MIANNRTKPARLHMGEIISWDIETNETPVSTIRAALSSAGIDAATCRDMRATSAFSRAKQKLSDGRTIDMVKGASDKTHVTYQLTLTRETRRDGKPVIDHSYETTVRMARVDGRIECEREDIRTAAQSLVDHHMGHRKQSDVTGIIQELFAKNGDLVSLTSKGVAYFVPDRFKDFTDKIETFIRDIGGTLNRYAVANGDENTKRSVKTSMADSIDRELRRLNQIVTLWDDSTRQKTKDKIAKEFQGLAFKIDSYAEYLDDKRTAALANVSAAKQAMQQRIFDIANPGLAPQAEPVIEVRNHSQDEPVATIPVEPQPQPAESIDDRFQRLLALA